MIGRWCVKEHLGCNVIGDFFLANFPINLPYLSLTLPTYLLHFLKKELVKINSPSLHSLQASAGVAHS